MSLISPALVTLDVRVDNSTDAVIAQMAALIGASGRGDADGVRAAMMEREAQMSTGMPGGFAIPHCKTSAVKEPTLGVLRLSTPVDFGAPDGPADLIIGICAPQSAADTHVQLLAMLARAFVRPGFLDALRAADTPEEVARMIGEVVDDSPSDAATSDPAEVGEVRLLAITSCPTGIAHTYMAAESLENAAKARGIDVVVEPQGSGGFTPFTQEQIDEASAVIVAADVSISGRERFAHLPVVSSGVKRAISEADALLDEALAVAKNPPERRVESASAAGSAPHESAPSWPRRLQAAVMTGVSYMIPFVAAGGLLIALGFAIGGYDAAFVAGDVALTHSLWDLPGQVAYESNGVEHVTEASGMALYLGSVLIALGQAGMGFLVAALSGYIAFGIAGRPGIAPGFITGAVAVTVGAGFLGGLITGILAGVVAALLMKPAVPRWLAGLMPVVIIPLITTLVVGVLMFLFLGRPLASLMNALQEGLQGMSGSSAIVLGVIVGLMMCFDLGGPVNKAAYLFATAGLSQGTQASFEIMAAVMAAGMVPPLAMALSTAVRAKLYTPVERDNGKAAWLLGAAFISEGAIPFAAADPLRVIPSMMVGGAVTGALSMALGVGSQAPHGGIFVAFAITPVLGYVASILAGVLVAAFLVTLLKEVKARTA